MADSLLINSVISPTEYKKKCREAASEKRRKATESQNAAENLSSEGSGKNINFGKLIKAHASTWEPDMDLKETLLIGTGLTAIMKNAGLISHPLNSIATFLGKSDTKQIFKGNKTLWKGNDNLMQEAYYQMYKAERRKRWQLGLFKKRYSANEYTALKDYMEAAVRNGNADEVAKATEALKRSHASNGLLPRLWKKIRGKEVAKPLSLLEEVKTGNFATTSAKEAFESGVKALSKTNKMTLGKAFKYGAGGKVGIILGLLGLLPEIKNIKVAYGKDEATGKKQLKQSLAKFAANWGGYIVGESIGLWAGAKIGAVIGSVVPGLGTAIGAISGAILGSVLSWGASKIVKNKVGENVSNELHSENLLKTKEGQEQLLNDLVAMAEKGEIKDAETLTALQEAVDASKLDYMG